MPMWNLSWKFSRQPPSSRFAQILWFSYKISTFEDYPLHDWPCPFSHWHNAHSGFIGVLIHLIKKVSRSFHVSLFSGWFYTKLNRYDFILTYKLN
jgi:hypothetical protein